MFEFTQMLVNIKHAVCSIRQIYHQIITEVNEHPQLRNSIANRLNCCVHLFIPGQYYSSNIHITFIGEYGLLKIYMVEKKTYLWNKKLLD